MADDLFHRRLGDLLAPRILRGPSWRGVPHAPPSAPSLSPRRRGRVLPRGGPGTEFETSIASPPRRFTDGTSRSPQPSSVLKSESSPGCPVHQSSITVNFAPSRPRIRARVQTFPATRSERLRTVTVYPRPHPLPAIESRTYILLFFVLKSS